jgi:hypothetical protein
MERGVKPAETETAEPAEDPPAVCGHVSIVRSKSKEIERVEGRVFYSAIEVRQGAISWPTVVS